MAVDIGIAVEALLGVGVQYGSAADYDTLVRTWHDSRPIPTEAALQTAYAAYLVTFNAEQTERSDNLTAATKAQVATLLTSADTRIAQIGTDRTTLAAATTLAQVRPIIDRQLNAEAVLIADLKLLIKALRWLV